MYLEKLPEDYQSSYDDERISLFYALRREFPDLTYVSSYKDNIEAYWDFLKFSIPGY